MFPVLKVKLLMTRMLTRDVANVCSIRPVQLSGGRGLELPLTPWSCWREDGSGLLLGLWAVTSLNTELDLQFWPPCRTDLLLLPPPSDQGDVHTRPASHYWAIYVQLTLLLLTSNQLLRSYIISYKPLPSRSDTLETELFFPCWMESVAAAKRLSNANEVVRDSATLLLHWVIEHVCTRLRDILGSTLLAHWFHWSSLAQVPEPNEPAVKPFTGPLNSDDTPLKALTLLAWTTRQAVER